MAKQVYNYELFTHKKEQLREIHRRRRRQRRIKQTICLVVFLFVLFIFYIIQQSRCNYYVYKDVVKTEENSGVNYEPFAHGYIKYSSNGIEYQKKFGTAIWNIALSFSKPFVAKTDKYIVLGDRGGNKMILFDEKGKLNEFTLKCPIVQLDVARNGNIEVLLEGEDCNYIEVYTMEGDMIAETMVTLEDTGYPIMAKLSPDGTQLAVSYYTIKELTGCTRIAFYDFSQQIQAESIPLKGGFDYENELIPKINFMDNNHVVAVGDTSTHYYDLSDEAKETKTVDFSERIESVFSGKNYTGYICNNDDTEHEERYHLYLYDKKGKEKVNTFVDMNYQNIQMVGNEIFATKDNECTILNKHGKILFQGTLEGSRIEKVLPCFGWRTYRFVFENKIVKLKLSFFGKESAN